MKIEWRTCFRVGVSVFLLYLCIQYWPAVARIISAALGAASPLFVGCAIAYFVNILMRFYERHYFPKKTAGVIAKSRRGICMVAAFLTLIIILILLITLIVPELVSCIGVIVSALPAAIDSIVDMLTEANIFPENIMEQLNAVDWESKMGQLLDLLANGAGTVVNAVVSAASSFFSSLVTVLVGFIFSVYLLIGKERLAGQCKRLMERYLRPTWNRKALYVLNVLNESFNNYIVGQCVEAVILGTLCTLGMLILRLPYATMVGTLIAFTALIPVAGAYIGGAVGALMNFSVSPEKALIFLIFLVLLQQVEGNLIYPKVVGSSLGLPALWVLAAVTVGGGIMGVTGMLLGVPVASALYRLLKNDLNMKRLTDAVQMEKETDASVKNPGKSVRKRK